MAFSEHSTKTSLAISVPNAALPRRARTSPGVPTWAHRIAHVVPLTTLPSGLWRLALGVGIPVGFSGELAEVYGAPGWITPYVILLSLLAEGLALLTLGLVRPWGERTPDWLPWIGGRRIPTMAVVMPAAAGAVLLTHINWTSALMWFGPDNNGDPDAPHGVAGLIMALCYAPMLAWGPLLGLVTVAYYRRRRRQSMLVPAPSRRERRWRDRRSINTDRRPHGATAVPHPALRSVTGPEEVDPAQFIR